MITITTKSPDLAISFEDVLNVDTIQSLKDGLGMMGMRFTGKPTKAHIVKTFDNNVKENPADVLRCLRPEELTLMGNTPHIYNVISNPIDYSTEKSMKTPLDSVLFEVSSKCREIIAYINKWSKGNKLRGMSFKELDCLSDSLFDYEDELDEYEGKLTSLIAATPQGFAARQEDIDSLMIVVGHVRHTIINMQEAVDKTIEITTSVDKRSDAKQPKQLMDELFGE